MENSRIVFLRTVLILSFGARVPAGASIDPYHLNGGVNGRHFWLDPNMINIAYMPLIRNAVTSWNATATRVSFTETSSLCCDSQADWYAKAYGSTGWRGVTVPRLSDGSGASTCVGCAPFENWDYAEISLNDDYLKYDCCLNRIQSTAGHEFGHSVGLDHSPITSALMYATIGRYDIYGTYTPQQNDDISLAGQLP